MKIKKKILEQITYDDVVIAINRWNSNENINPIFRMDNKQSRIYHLVYKENIYNSKVIFAIAYEVHFGKFITTTELTGGISNNGVVTHLNNLGFEILTDTELLVSENNIEEEKDNPYETVLTYKEGKKKELYVTKYERNMVNRKKAIEIHGIKCMICGFDFEKVYGEAGRNFIEVHHVKPLCEYDEEVEINPKTDLVCICANCHRIIHRRKDRIYTVEEVKKYIDRQLYNR